MSIYLVELKVISIFGFSELSTAIKDYPMRPQSFTNNSWNDHKHIIVHEQYTYMYM